MTLSVDDALAAIGRASSAAEALRELAGWIRPAVDVVRVSLRRAFGGGEKLELIAVWSRHPTQLEPGHVLRATATSWPAMLGGNDVVVDSDEVRALNEILQTEGIASWASILLRDERGPWGILSFSSDERAAFDALEDTLRALGVAVGPVLRGLASA